MAAELQRMEHTGAAPATGLASGINNSVTSFSILSGTGYPTGAVGPFILCLDPGTGSEEKVLCSARSGTTVTVAGGGRGYDGTAAAAHSSGTTNVQHVLGAIEIDDDNRHVYTTTDDDHTQYARTDGTRAFTGATTVSSGGLTVTAGGLTVSAGTTAVQALTATTGSFSSTLGVTGAVTLSSTLGVTGNTTGTGTGSFATVAATGIALETGQARCIGGSATVEPPSFSGALQGDYFVDFKYGLVWVCTSAGTPGTWVAAGCGNLFALVYRNGAWTTASAGAVIAYDTALSDTNTMVNLSTGVATVPIAGLYQISAQFRYTTTATTDLAQITVTQNSTVIANAQGPANTSGAGDGYAGVTVLAVCAANDTIKASNLTNVNALTGTTGQASTFMHLKLAQ